MLTITDSHFYSASCRAKYSIYVENCVSDATINNCVFSTSLLKALDFEAGDLHIKNCKFGDGTIKKIVTVVIVVIVVIASVAGIMAIACCLMSRRKRQREFETSETIAAQLI